MAARLAQFTFSVELGRTPGWREAAAVAIPRHVIRAMMDAGGFVMIYDPNINDLNRYIM